MYVVYRSQEWIKNEKGITEKYTGGKEKKMPRSIVSLYQQHPDKERSSRKKHARKAKDSETFIREAREVHGDNYGYEDVVYTSSDQTVKIQCPTHGLIEQTPRSHLQGTGCTKCGRHQTAEAKRKDTQTFVKRAREVHGDNYGYEDVVYTSSDQTVKIQCPTHGLIEQTPRSHLQGTGCTKCGRHQTAEAKRKDTQTFVKRAREVHGDKYGYEDVVYTHCDENVMIRCPDHGPFSQTPSNHLQGKGCTKCGRHRTVEARKKDTQTFVKRAREVHGDKYGYQEVVYMNTHENVMIRCPDHDLFPQTPKNHLRGQGCMKCAATVRGEARRKGTETFVIEAKKVHGDVYNYEDVVYTTCEENVMIRCRTHGPFSQTPSNHLRGQGCPKCSYRKWWSKKGIDFVEWMAVYHGLRDMVHAMNIGEYKVPGTRYSVDGYSESRNTIYEFHGTIWHGDPRLCDPDDTNFRTGIRYGKLYQQTLERTRCFRERGYDVVEMWEADWDMAIRCLRQLQKRFRSRVEQRNRMSLSLSFLDRWLIGGQHELNEHTPSTTHE